MAVLPCFPLGCGGRFLYAPSLGVPLIRSAALVLMALTLHPRLEGPLFDFQTAGQIPWRVVNDSVMGGRSTSQWNVIPGGALFQGVVSLENGGGFASVRSGPVAHDLAHCDGFLLRVRGDGRRYKLLARADERLDGALYQAAFHTKKGEWLELRLPLNEFVPTYRGRRLAGVPPVDPAKVKSFGLLVSDEQEGPFRLELAWIKTLARAST